MSHGMAASANARDYQLALGHFSGGRRGEAEAALRRLLSRRPDDPDALHLLGLISHQEGRGEEAVGLLRRALSLQPEFAAARNNLGLVLEAMGRLDEAIEELRRTVRSAPRHIDALINLANALRKKGAADEAVAQYERALALGPGRLDVRTNLAVALDAGGRVEEAIAVLRQGLDAASAGVPGGGRESPEAWNTLGHLLRASGKHEEAVAALQRALKLSPDFPEALNNLGAALQAGGKAGLALAPLRRAAELRPDYADALSNLGNALREDAKLEEAVQVLRSAVAADPGHAAAHNNLAIALKAAGELEEATSAVRRAMELRPNWADAHNTLGTILAERGEAEEAIAAFETAISLKPDVREACHNLNAVYQGQGKAQEAVEAFRRLAERNRQSPEARVQLGDVLRGQHRLDEAAEEYQRALGLRPGMGEAQWNLGFLSLLLGDFARGWPAYEARFQVFKSGFPQFEGPAWDGGALEGRTVLLLAEQGFGDVIQFVRYAPLVRGRGGRVVLACLPELARLLRGQQRLRLEGVYVTGETVHFDLRCPLLSLPKVFGTTLQTIPAEVPYLSAEPELAAAWAQRLKAESEPGAGAGTARRALRVGLVWAGNPAHANDRNRSIALAALAPLGRVAGVRFYSLQKGPAAEQAKAPPAGMALTDVSADLGDFADTAAVLENLDVVIAVDTAVAHLAGAMGGRVWVLLPFMPDWRWMLGRSDSPWYPSMRLFRQLTAGEWAVVIERVGEELAELAREVGNRPPSAAQ